MLRKIGILGGAFNPPHFGHLILAKKAKKKLKLDKVFFIPYNLPPLKKENLAKAKERYEMTKMLIEKEKDFEILDYEIKKEKPAFTIETISYLKKKFKKAQFFWIIGEDSLKEIIEGKWKGGMKVLDLAKFVVFSRIKKPSLKEIPKFLEKRKKEALSKVIFFKAKIPISSFEIREKLKKKENISQFLPKKILNYIKEKKLYV